ncbi:hypothetical protein HELRODRAFT_124649, partial [Helobdella robusta]|uniref:Guanylate kinase-like domain-containing protein n=1 Tax=Helobdella robusta TaxID=6412 RepID=T1EH23_HELRO
TRPVIIVGWCKDKLNDQLVERWPTLFETCVPHTTRPMRAGELSGREYFFVLSKEQMEQDIQDGMFMEVGTYNEHYYGVSYRAVHEVAKQHKHCLLDVSLDCVPQLSNMSLHPIVLFVRP